MPSVFGLCYNLPKPLHNAGEGNTFTGQAQARRAGAKRLMQEYGDTLVCVRYRYDEIRQVRLKTVELVVEVKGWTPPPAKFADNKIVAVRIAYNESAMKQLAKNAGGRWDPAVKLWRISYGKIKGTLLEKHIILDA